MNRKARFKFAWTIRFVWYRISRLFIYSVISFVFYMAMRGGWQAIFLPRQWNHKSNQYHDTTWLDSLFNLFLSGLSAFISLLCLLMVIGLILSTNGTKTLYLQHRQIKRDKRRNKKAKISRGSKLASGKP